MIEYLGRMYFSWDIHLYAVLFEVVLFSFFSRSRLYVWRHVVCLTYSVSLFDFLRCFPSFFPLPMSRFSSSIRLILLCGNIC